jgi:hypothetical protein
MSGTHVTRMAIILCGSLAGSRADDKAQAPIEVHEWSVWVANPAQTTINTARVYANAMPGSVGTSRPKIEDKDLAGRFPIAPVSVAQFFGDACKDVDVEIRPKKGSFVAHWPPATERGGRLQWFGADFTTTPAADIPLGYVPETHWFQTLRGLDGALYLKQESRVERFVSYDAELNIAVPVRIRGGPDEYTLHNLTDRKLLDVAVIAPADKGIRVGWLDELPSATEEKKDKPKSKETSDQKAESVFQAAESKPRDKEEPLPPLPAEGDPTVRARVDQVLNRPVTVAVDQVPTRDVLDLVAGQARVRFELDDRAMARADVDLGKPMSLNANGVAARDALADVMGNLGLSYRVTESGTLFITTAARLAEDADKKGSAIEGPPIKLVMSPPQKPESPSYREMTRDALARRLAGHGLRDEAVRIALDRYGKSLFEPGELIVLAHLSREAIDDAVLLDVFPPPRKFVRTALVVVHGVDPRLQDRARTLVKQLGDLSSRARDGAESKLLELGPVAVPALEDALLEKDLEIVFRAERILLRLHRNVP